MFTVSCFLFERSESLEISDFSYETFLCIFNLELSISEVVENCLMFVIREDAFKLIFEDTFKFKLIFEGDFKFRLVYEFMFRLDEMFRFDELFEFDE